MIVQLKEVYLTNYIKVKIALGSPKSAQGIRKVQSLIKIKMDEIEQIPGWKLLPPAISNAIRHAVIRIAFASYKIGLIG